MILYLDASALVKRYVTELGSKEVITLTAAAEAVATSLVSRAEVAAALARAVRLGVLDQDSGRQAHVDSHASGLTSRESPSVKHSCRAETLAWDHGLRGYDAVQLASFLNRFRYYDRDVMPQTLALPTALSDQLTDIELTLKQILSRIPGLNQLYRRTFHESALTERLDLHTSQYDADGYWKLRIDDPQIFSDRAALIAIVTDWRNRFPVLSKWRVVEAVRQWGHSIILFGNIARAGVR